MLSLHADGTPLDTEKQTYGMAFMPSTDCPNISEPPEVPRVWCKVSIFIKCSRLRSGSLKTTDTLNLYQNWQFPPKYGYDGTGLASKTMNTHIHLLEAYTSLYRYGGNEGLQKRLNTLINLVVDKFTIRKQITWKLFLIINGRSLEDIDSYGHDIETGWLLTETAEHCAGRNAADRTDCC